MNEAIGARLTAVIDQGPYANPVVLVQPKSLSKTGKIKRPRLPKQAVTILKEFASTHGRRPTSQEAQALLEEVKGMTGHQTKHENVMDWFYRNRDPLGLKGDPSKAMQYRFRVSKRSACSERPSLAGLSTPFQLVEERENIEESTPSNPIYWEHRPLVVNDRGADIALVEPPLEEQFLDPDFNLGASLNALRGPVNTTPASTPEMTFGEEFGSLWSAPSLDGWNGRLETESVLNGSAPFTHFCYLHCGCLQVSDAGLTHIS